MSKKSDELDLNDILAESDDDDSSEEEAKTGGAGPAAAQEPTAAEEDDDDDDGADDDDGSKASGKIDVADPEQLAKDLEEQKQHEPRSRGGSEILMSTDSARRHSKDDSSIQVLMQSKKHPDDEQFEHIQNLRANRNTTAHPKSGTFTEGTEQEQPTGVIFAAEAKISQNPAKVTIDPIKEDNDDEPNLDDILGESDSSSSNEEAYGKEDSDESSERSSFDDRVKKDDELSGVSFDNLANKSIDSGPQELPDVVDKANYLPFISEKYEFQNDVLEVVEQNERSYKMVAEKMIQKSSQLDQVATSVVQPDLDEAMQAQRRLMHFYEYSTIAQKFQGISAPYCIRALENFIAIGSSDGSVRLFNTKDESELKTIIAKDVKQNAAYSVDVKRVKGPNLLHVVAGHAKGQVVLYEVRGLPKFQSSGLQGTVSVKHIKTVSDIHEGPVVQVQFYGVFRANNRVIQVVTCDMAGCVYLLKFVDDVLGYSCIKKCFYRQRLGGAAFAIKPLYYDFDSKANEQVGAFNKLDGNPYVVKKDKDLFDFDVAEEVAQLRNHLVAFGALERIVLAQVQPELTELFYIERPSYIDSGIVPYLDWGEGLSPVYRDRTYPILAITWGRTVQLAIWTNHKDIGARPEIKFDGFYICDGFSIDQCFFLDESLLFVLINKKEVKILYTQRFTPGVFDERILQSQQAKKLDAKSSAQQTLENKRYFMAIKEKFTGTVSNYAEVDKGYRLVQKEEIRHKDILDSSLTTQRTKFNFHPTICKNNAGTVISLGKTAVFQAKLIHWSEFLELTRRKNPDDWLKVLRAALDIFNGKMVGLAGLPDEKEAREHALRERMKELLRQNIDACIKEFQEGAMIQSKTLRVATEFCIKVGALDHLFGELFNMFAEAGIEQRYFENLEAFILSGKLKKIVIPDRILTRIFQYYRQKDVELLEKAIMNLNLTKYSQTIDWATNCERDFLTSALICMLMTIYDNDQFMENAVCLQILNKLYQVMVKSKLLKTKDEVMAILQYQDSTVLFEANQLEDKALDPAEHERRMLEKEKQQAERKLKLDIEHSKTYIGYKLMWIMRMFLEGKKFPTGTLSSFKWRMYVFDIVRFITNPMFLKWLLTFDAQRFFKLIEPLYLQHEPYTYIATQDDFVEKHSDEVAGLAKCPTHQEILQVITKTVREEVQKELDANNGATTSKIELIQNGFMFFIARIAKKPQISISQELIEDTIIKQLQFHRNLLSLELNVDELAQNKFSMAKVAQIAMQRHQSSKVEAQAADDEDLEPAQRLYKSLVKHNEADVLNLIRSIEHRVHEDVIKGFCKEADHSPMYMVRIHLHQFLHNYQKCLQMFFKIKVIKQHVFQWLQDIAATIPPTLNGENTHEQLQQLILKNIGSFIDMDPQKTVQLCDQWFERNYSQMVESIYNYTPSRTRAYELAFRFINTVLEMHEKSIIEEYRIQTFYTAADELNSAAASMRAESQNKFKKLIIDLTKILCKPKYSKFAMEYMKRDYFPIEECLQICEEKGIMDACAILYRRKGDFEKAIKQYIQVLTRLSQKRVISELYLTADIPFNDPSTKQAIRRFDEILSMIMDICDKDGSRNLKETEAEQLWLNSIEMIYIIKQRITDDMKDLDQKDLDNFHQFLLTRIQAFMMRMAEYVKLEKIIDFLHRIGTQNTYQEFQPTFEEKVKRETYNENILQISSDLIMKDLKNDEHMLASLRDRGCVAAILQCDKCKMPLQTKWDKQPIQMFKCGHNYHRRCLTADGQCSNSDCYNEHEGISKIIQATTETKRARAGRSRASSPNKRGRSRATTATEGSDSDSSRSYSRNRRGALTQQDMMTLHSTSESSGFVDMSHHVEARTRQSIKQVREEADQVALGGSRLHIELDDESAIQETEFEKFVQRNLEFENANFERAMYFDQYNRY